MRHHGRDRDSFEVVDSAQLLRVARLHAFFFADDDPIGPRIRLRLPFRPMNELTRFPGIARTGAFNAPNQQTISFPPAGELTKRENEVMHWLSEGKRDREIACKLGVSLRTAEHHVSSILQKLGVETRTAAARLALQTAFAPPVSSASLPPRSA